jgi:hypothetical protein
MSPKTIFVGAAMLFAGPWGSIAALAYAEDGWARHYLDGTEASVEVPCSAGEVQQSLKSGPLSVKQGDEKLSLACSKDKDGIGFAVKLSDASNEKDSFANMIRPLPSGEAAGRNVVLPDGRNAYDISMGRMLSVRFIETSDGGYVALSYFDILNQSGAASKERFFNSVRFEVGQ